MVKWKGNGTVPVWSPNTVTVSGSPGNFFGFRRHGQTEKESLFFTLLARPVTLYHNATIDSCGIKCYRYKIEDSEFANATNNPVNEQYDQLRWNGVFNLTRETGGLFYTRGHFLGCDPEIVNSVLGLAHGNVSSDDSTFDVEPLTGAVVTSERVIQSNLWFGGYSNPIARVNITRSLMHPLIIMRINSKVSDEQSTDLIDALNFYSISIIVNDMSLYGGSIIGSCIFVYALWITHRKRQDEEAAEHEKEALALEDPTGEESEPVELMYSWRS
jgi:hypothetical protein